MSLLKTEPAGSVKSLEELFAIAAAMEQEAADRYAEIAERMRREGDPALAEVFERLSADEQGHLDSVVALVASGPRGRHPIPPGSDGSCRRPSTTKARRRRTRGC